MPLSISLSLSGFPSCCLLFLAPFSAFAWVIQLIDSLLFFLGFGNQLSLFTERLQTPELPDSHLAPCPTPHLIGSCWREGLRREWGAGKHRDLELRICSGSLPLLGWDRNAENTYCNCPFFKIPSALLIAAGRLLYWWRWYVKSDTALYIYFHGENWMYLFIVLGAMFTYIHRVSMEWFLFNYYWK